jgi:hypothetical protein
MDDAKAIAGSPQPASYPGIGKTLPTIERAKFPLILEERIEA